MIDLHVTDTTLNISRQSQKAVKNKYETIHNRSHTKSLSVSFVL